MVPARVLCCFCSHADPKPLPSGQDEAETDLHERHCALALSSLSTQVHQGYVGYAVCLQPHHLLHLLVHLKGCVQVLHLQPHTAQALLTLNSSQPTPSHPKVDPQPPLLHPPATPNGTPTTTPYPVSLAHPHCSGCCGW